METVVTRVNENDDAMDFSDWLERGRSWWKARAGRIIECNYLLVIDANNVVRAAGRIAGVLKDLEGGSGRVSIEVLPDPENEWIGTKIWRPESRNPVVYLDKIRSL